eukprot:1161709-Pelagomonas_calceolata.AAC.3
MPSMLLLFASWLVERQNLNFIYCAIDTVDSNNSLPSRLGVMAFKSMWILLIGGLLAEGLAMVDDLAPEGERLYWFPCLSSGMQEEQ